MAAASSCKVGSNSSVAERREWHCWAWNLVRFLSAQNVREAAQVPLLCLKVSSAM